MKCSLLSKKKKPLSKLNLYTTAISHSTVSHCVQCSVDIPDVWIQNKHTTKPETRQTRGNVVLKRKKICTSKTFFPHTDIENIQPAFFVQPVCKGAFRASWRLAEQAGRHTSSTETYRVAKVRTYKTPCTAVTASSVQFLSNVLVRPVVILFFVLFFERSQSRDVEHAQQPSQSFVISPNLTIFKLLSSSLK